MLVVESLVLFPFCFLYGFKSWYLLLLLFWEEREGSFYGCCFSGVFFEFVVWRVWGGDFSSVFRVRMCVGFFFVEWRRGEVVLHFFVKKKSCCFRFCFVHVCF